MMIGFNHATTMTKNSVIKWVNLLILKIDKDEKSIRDCEIEIIKNKLLLSGVKTFDGFPKGFKIPKEFNINLQKDIDVHLKLIEIKRSIIKDDTSKKICLTRLAVIERFILNRIWEYPLEYEYRTENINDIHFNIILIIKPQIGEINPNIFISLAVPITCVQMSPKIEFLYFAEFMFKRDERYYNREDFGLEKYDDHDNDQVFRIKNIEELYMVLQKIDSWYGSGLD